MLRARNLIERYGMAGWLAMDGLGDMGPHPLLADAIDVVESELAELEHAADVARARDEWRRRRAGGT